MKVGWFGPDLARHSVSRSVLPDAPDFVLVYDGDHRVRRRGGPVDAADRNRPITLERENFAGVDLVNVLDAQLPERQQLERVSGVVLQEVHEDGGPLVAIAILPVDRLPRSAARAVNRIAHSG